MTDGERIWPTDDRVLVARSDPEEVSRGGIVIPDAARERQSRGEVRAVGPGVRTRDGRRAPMSVRQGDVVVFPRLAGSDVRGDRLVIVRESEILGVLEP